MEKVFEIAFAPVNIALTVVFILVLLYWIISTVFGIDFDMDLDVDIEVDAEASFDARTNLDIDSISNAEVNKQDVVSNRRGQLKWWQIVLIYFNFVELPFMFTFTFWILFWWVISMVGTYFTGTSSGALGFLFFFIGMIFSLPLTKIFTTPFKSLFKNINRVGEESIEILGREGVLSSDLSGDKMTTLEIFIESSPLKIYVTSKNGLPIKNGTKVQITNKVENKQIYIIEPIN